MYHRVGDVDSGGRCAIVGPEYMKNLHLPHISQLPSAPTQTGDRTHNLRMYPDWELNPPPSGYRTVVNQLRHTTQGNKLPCFNTQ